MPYVAFFDMLGTRESAKMSSEEYQNALNAFHGSIEQVIPCCDCKVYGYSDNAYAEFSSLDDVVNFFRLLRMTLIQNHRYFSAAVDSGSLEAQKISFNTPSTSKKKRFDDQYGYSMKFTHPSVTQIYINERNFSGIGISLSCKVIDDMNSQKRFNDYCKSIYVKRIHENGALEYEEVFDISYDYVTINDLQYVISDFIVTSILNKNAGRYYLTPIISMIKKLKINVIESNLQELITLIHFNKFEDVQGLTVYKDQFSLLCICALIDYIFSLKNESNGVNKIEMCKNIIKECKFAETVILSRLSTVPTAVISSENKQKFVSVIYNMKKCGNTNKGNSE